MSETLEGLIGTSVETQEQAVGLIEKLFTVAEPGAVFSEPVTAEGRTIITAAEVNVGVGVGFGFGGGSGPGRYAAREAGRPSETAEPRARVKLEGTGSEEGETDASSSEAMDEASGMGGGGGGGGGASGRPVAVISITEEGVEVEPVVDVTKIALAFFTALGSMFFMLTRMRKAAQR